VVKWLGEGMKLSLKQVIRVLLTPSGGFVWLIRIEGLSSSRQVVAGMIPVHNLHAVREQVSR
jgi:hypothetical protein